MASGMFAPTLDLSGTLNTIIGLLPLKALADGLRAAYDPAAQGPPIAQAAVLGVWAAVGIALAQRYFRWDP
jgi:ABC-2 type transport system permease protein